MKIKLDENVPAMLGAALTACGYDVDTVQEEQLTGQPDRQVWRSAPQAGRFLITQDPDFSDLRRFAPGTHAGILPVRLRTPGRIALLRRIVGVCNGEDVERWARRFVVLTDHKLRVRRPEAA